MKKKVFYKKMASTDCFKHAQLFHAVKVGFTTYHYDVFEKIEYLLIKIYHQESYPMTTVLVFEDTPEHRQKVAACYRDYLHSERYKKIKK